MHPWLEPAWQQFQASRAAGRLPHALLLAGPAGVGKGDFAAELAAALLCGDPAPDGHACGRCTGCRLRVAGTHPDFFRLEPEEAGKAIRIDAVRALCAELAMTSHAAGSKIAVIDPADALNVNAANSLLKTLEEPTDNTLIVLVSSAPQRLPATIRSRCQQLRLPLPSAAQARDWLAATLGDEAREAEALLNIAGGSPLRAAELLAAGMPDRYRHWARQVVDIARQAADPVQVAADWHGDRQPDCLRWFQRWLQGLIRQRALGGPAGGGLQALAEQVDLRLLFRLLDRVGAALDQWSAGLNHQLVLEEVLINWAELFQTTRRTSAA